MAENELTKFIDGRKQIFDRIGARLAAAGKTSSFKLRLRVRFGSKLNTDEKSLKLTFKGRRVWLHPRQREQSLGTDAWVVFSATRFPTLEAATQFGQELQRSLSIICALRGLPVDVGGDNRPTGQFCNEIKEAVLRDTGVWLRDDVHGLDVYPATVTSRIITVEGNLTIKFVIEPYIDAMNQSAKQINRLSEAGFLSCELLNAAMMSNHPVAAATLSLAAVELLAVNEKRSSKQKEWIKKIRDSLETDATIIEADKVVLRKAVAGMFNIGISDRVKKMLARLGMEDRADDWDRIYKLRSALFHGVRRLTQSEIISLGSEAPTLSRQIMRRYLEDQVGELPQ
ncbi:hypothetical protein [Sphingomonas mollis]|uniref:Apea-like HEPN domain-containing protein n=1 Tax=Sphingomonas mollis TaxID=2795726 RepID=A0ABS0XPI6_9SPHN|nr:hypothetical protein [Sphingomonas sp. BT553]MBJ6121638.1 hypothetical protein [Sphingomonas sp. BT553]